MNKCWRGERRRSDLSVLWTVVPPRTILTPPGVDLFRLWTVRASSYVTPPTMNTITSCGLHHHQCYYHYQLYYKRFVFTALVGPQEEHPACKNWAMRCWRGYLSAARCKWFAYGPADATATPSSLALLKSGWFKPSGASSPRMSWKRGH